jgi:translocator protein
MQIRARDFLSLGLFVALVFGGGTAVGLSTLPGEWYAALRKPDFNPPNWIFGPVWSVLYVMIAVAGWRTWRTARDSVAMKIWWAQLALNFLWSPIFFVAHQTGAALAVILLLLAAILAFIAMMYRRDKIAAWLFAPYAAWVGFASLLNGFVWALN